MSFKDDLMQDLNDSFFNEDEFGEVVTLTRGGASCQMKGLFDTPGLSNESVGEVSVIAHTPRLFVRSSDLPDSKPRKGDVFTLGSTPFHRAMKLSAIDFVFEKDGTVVYSLEESK
ncbi:MAG: hypothetical protein J6W54_03305 [Fibrobacter sp.]|uniref:head-tail joining protein n=1 Tax=Fibrobacter sp. TaxID=35828 RepID=UPI001B07CCDD|nr:hypothetical protein [Fibrobacter sp.]MBO7060110.1 hypothetical protein [Fibrobacter sp.]